MFVVVCLGLTLFFSHIITMSSCGRELNAHFYRAASMKYHAPDTWHDTTPSHIILTLGQHVLALPKSLSAKRGAASTIFNDFGMSWPGIEPVTSHSSEQTLYQLSYQGQSLQCLPRPVESYYEPRHEKTCFSHMRTTKVQIRQSDQHLCCSLLI